LQQKTVAQFSIYDGRENRSNGNQEKGSEEKGYEEKALNVHFAERQTRGRESVPLVFCANLAVALVGN
jgi:hypothetical protein